MHWHGSAGVMATRRQAGMAVVEADALFEETLVRIQTLAQWGIGWRDYEAPSPSAERIACARAWIEAMRCDALALNLLWLKPMVTASEEGEILFEWWNEPKRLAVYITDRGADYI